VKEILRDLNQIVFFQIVVLTAGAWLTTELVQRLLPRLANRMTGRYRLYILAAIPVLRLIIISVAAWLIISKIVEPTFENLITLLGALGLALGFAFKDYVGSLIAGIVTLYEMPYRLGDWISIEGAYGEVKNIGMRAVEIVTPDDTVVVIPHLKLWDKLIYNANDNSPYLLCVADFFLAPHHDAKAVSQALHDVALTSSYLQIQKPVNVTVQEKPWGTHYRLKAYPVDPRDQFRFVTDLTIRGKEALIKLGLEFSVAPAVAGPSRW